MKIFESMAKIMLYTLIITIIYSISFDFGKAYLAHSKNYFIAGNAATYVTKFSVDPEKLQDFEQKSLSLTEAKNTVEDYYKKQYENQGFVLTRSAMSGMNRHIMEFYPKNNRTKTGHSFQGPIFVRTIYYGFEGTPASPYGGQDGLVMMNIEQKIPTSLMALYKSYDVEINYEDGANGRDFEGFSGYYSIESFKAFSLNVVK